LREKNKIQRGTIEIGRIVKKAKKKFFPGSSKRVKSMMESYASHFLRIKSQIIP